MIFIPSLTTIRSHENKEEEKNTRKMNEENQEVT